MPGGTSGVDGWCYQNMTTVSCSSLYSERDCLDTYYCFWNYGNSTCQDPSAATINETIFIEWNPGCYIFDMNTTACGNITGCNWTGSYCVSIDTNIDENGITCSNINDSSICNTIAVLSSCCAWQAGSCQNNSFSTACWDQMQAPPDGAEFCEDYNSFTDKTLCEQISGAPWYMPCKWNNATSRCQFKSGEVFGNSTNSLILLDNKKTCEAAGGIWITDNYCEGNLSIPMGRCEYNFDSVGNCDKECYACEYQADGRAHNSTNAAKSACVGSRLGKCKFISDSNAPNGYGYCEPKSLVSDCKNDCGACRDYGYTNAAQKYTGDQPSYDTCNAPSCYCEQSPANCKWVPDPSDVTDESKGFCVSKNEKTCEDSCDKCTTQDSCVNLGRTATSNESGTCEWNTAQEICSKKGETTEVCWDGVDNNDDGLIDCADPVCYADPDCGFVVGDCFGWTDAGNDTCIANGCEWVSDPWGSWCDYPGSQCWQFDGNETACRSATQVLNELLNISSGRINVMDINESYTFNLSNVESGWVNGSVVIIRNSTGTVISSGNYTVNYTGHTISFLNTTFTVDSILDNLTYVDYYYYPSSSACEWFAGTGSGSCEQDWSNAEQCHGLNSSGCTGNSNCTWSNDTWCDGPGSGSDWCNDFGGWCDHVDFMPNQCWKYDGNQSQCSDNNCTWNPTDWPYCSVDYSGDCWQYNNETQCTANGCYWQTDQWGSWCTHTMDACHSLNIENTCTANSDCIWNEWNYCEPKCHSSNLTSDTCRDMTGCRWVDGWCNDDFAGSTCQNTTNWNNATSCSADSKCRWKEPGWCNPQGFTGGAGVGGAGSGKSGMTCYKHDGNETACLNQTGCGWFAEYMPFCGVDFSNDCWIYYDEPSCLSGGCYWDNSGSFCMNPSDQCWNNNTLWQNQTACNANSYCNWTQWNSCEPSCFSIMSEGDCGLASGCRWMTGWCNPGTTADHFANMEGGEPVPLGGDDFGDASPASIDIIGFGMKDTGTAFAFGAMVMDFSNSSICNDEKMIGGRIGSGNETHKLYIYLDTDGSTSGGCALSHDTTTSGYEFRFKYEVIWNTTTSKAVDTFTSFKCDNGAWKAANIKFSTWKKIMCSEIGGSMVSVEKTDLGQYSSLYDPSNDMRVFVATASDSGSISSPTDTAGPAWTTPDAIDFTIEDFFKTDIDTSKFGNILKKGFVEYEDCFNDVDDDEDGLVDCFDYDCKYAKICENVGVNAAGYVDTKAPKVVGVKIEEYNDSALIMYDTNKPTNGTLKFYYNDSQCSSLNATIHDIGIRKNSVRPYKVWHTAEIYDDNGTASLNYPLLNSTTYYYKLQVCDSDGKCAVSKCSSFTTSSHTRCGYCNFVTRIKTPSDWTVSYDADLDMNYEHIQGQVCGPNAGMKTNFADGRRVNILLNNSAEKSAIWFLNATLTRTGLNDKVRTISDIGSIPAGTTTDSSGNSIGYAGILTETRDKIINNLHPEVCRIQIPGTGTCSALWHCSDNLTNCVERTTEATLLQGGDDYCIWEIPYCEFSIWAGGQPGTPSGNGDSTNGGGGSSSGGGSSTAISQTHLFPEMTPGIANVFRVTSRSLAIKEISIDVLNPLTNVRVTVTNVSSIPEPISQQLTGTVFRYMNITTENLDATDISSIKIKFNITKSWLSSNGFSFSDVVLQRYFGGWQKLSTVIMSENDTNVEYEAISPGLSTFAITAESVQQLLSDTTPEPPTQERPPSVPPSTERPQLPDTLKETENYVLLIAVVIVIILLGWFYYHGHHHIRRKRVR